jgi:lipid-A-disaccharide synthase
MKRPPRILISAGEASGDRLGAGLARALRLKCPEIELLGMGGSRMADEGVRLVQDSAEVAVVGIQEVLSHLPAIRKAMRLLERVLVTERPDLLVPIDFPDFNLRLSARARRAGVAVVYFVSPQVWAWRRRRVHRIRELVRRMLVLFPFETEFYERSGVPVTFVGHPLAEHLGEQRSREELCAAAGLDPGQRVIALVPGSRRQEVERLLPPMLEAARRVRRRHSKRQLLVTRAPGLSREWFEQQLAGEDATDLRVHAGDFPEILSVCEAGVVASGTASLEAAVTGLPMVVVYRVAAVSYMIFRVLVKLPHVAMPNLVAGRRVVPELVQSECTPDRIAEELLRYLDDPDVMERVRAELREIRGQLGGPGVYDRAADQILAELNGRGERAQGTKTG